MSQLHIRVEGRSLDRDLDVIGLNSESTNEEVLAQTARYLDVPRNKLDNHAVVREASGNITVRPNAVFG